jgi:HrpA-like RNA helicase
VEFDAPEIQRCNLSSAVLQLVAMNQDPFTFEYIDNPGREASKSLRVVRTLIDTFVLMKKSARHSKP